MAESPGPPGNTIFSSTRAARATLADTRLARSQFVKPADLAAMAACHLSRQDVRANGELVREGDAADTLYFLADGWACQFKTTRDGRRQITAVLVAGDICNLDAVMFRPLDCGVRMLTAGTVLSVSRKRVIALAAASPGIGHSIGWCAFVENAILSQWSLCLGRLSSRERLAHLLCELAVRLGHDAPTGDVVFDMPLTQDHLADALGLTPVHVNRTMQQFRSDGLLTSTLRRIVIPDIALLRRIGEFDPNYLHRADGSGRDHDTIESYVVTPAQSETPLS